MITASITKPTLILDRKKCQKNISVMTEKARKAGVAFRPHFKTHQSHEVGRWFREAGVDRITCSSLSMANYFADDGWNDITVAFPVNVLETDLINQLATKIKLNVLVESTEAVMMLGKKVTNDVGIFLKIDAGYGRTGIDFANFAEIDKVISELYSHNQMHFKGFLAHAGNSYSARSSEQVADVQNKTLENISKLIENYSDTFSDLIISVGDTPTCSIMDNFGVANEIRPGCFVFYDLMQQQIGCCDYSQIAVALACPVVAKHPERNEVVIYGGGVHLSKDRIEEEGKSVYGKVANKNDNGWDSPMDGVYLKSLSQEHGILNATDSFIQKVNIGDILPIFPVHVCMAADLLDGYLTTEGQWIDKRINSNQ